MVPPLIAGVLGAWAMLMIDTIWLRGAGGAVLGVSSFVLAALVAQMRRPRVAYEAGRVLFNLRSGAAIAVPVELVEAFFLGQGPLMLPGSPQGGSTTNLVARISQRDASYAARHVKPALGAWCESYVTMRGTWCERLDGELIRKLNHRLREVTEQAAAGPAG
jgi:hypothetical protein